MKLVTLALLLVVASIFPAAAQTWDTSGNGMLQGTYYFRNAIWIVGDDSGDLTRAIAVYGNINFDGNGNYNLTNTQIMDSNAGVPQSFSASGTYSISASGFGFLSHPLSTSTNQFFIYGMVSNGVFVGSTTEDGFNDLLIAAQVSTPVPTNASFRGAYSMVQFDQPSGSPPDTRDSTFVLNPDGNGGIGTVSASGHIAARGSSAVTQNIAGVKYFFSNGGANISFPGSLSSSNLIVGTKYLYLSADGNFVFGGSPTAFDMIVGVRGGGAAPAFNGLYYQAGAYQDESQLSNGVGDLNTFYGSLKAGGGIILAHQRILSVFNNSAYDYTYDDTFALKADGTYDDGTNFHYIFGPGGVSRIGIGNGPYLGISAAIQAPSFTPSGVFIDPTGVVNAASSAMFTSGIAPGELITLYGSNLGTSPANVQVLINNRPAPLISVTPNQISALVPFATTEFTASIQVINNGVLSNTVSEFVNLTAPGVFTRPAGGLGTAAALHSDFSLVTADKPAQLGETISVYLTGLGAVTPTVADGTPGPSGPFSLTTNTISVYIGGTLATTSFVGLAPQLIGLYQINVTIPTGIATGTALLEVSGPDYFSSQATIPIGNGGSIAVPAARVPRPQGLRAVGKRRP